MNVDPSSKHYLDRVPLQVSFSKLAGPYSAPNLLALLPLQGTPLDPLTTYAAFVTKAVTSNGTPLAQSPQMQALAAGTAPPGMSPAAFAHYGLALAALADAGVAASDLAALTTFTTWDPTAEMGVYRAAALALPPPAPTAPFALSETFDEYCVYRTTIDMPDFQAGTPPYGDAGGGWATNDAGEPEVQTTETANFVVTVPRSPMPDGGFPLVIFCPTGAGPSGTTPLAIAARRPRRAGRPSSPAAARRSFWPWRAGRARASTARSMACATPPTAATRTT